MLKIDIANTHHSHLFSNLLFKENIIEKNIFHFRMQIDYHLFLKNNIWLFLKPFHYIRNVNFD